MALQQQNQGEDRLRRGQERQREQAQRGRPAPDRRQPFSSLVEEQEQQRQAAQRGERSEGLQARGKDRERIHAVVSRCRPVQRAPKGQGQGRREQSGIQGGSQGGAWALAPGQRQDGQGAQQR